ncbi:MAG: hypothetical protein VKM34_07395 [Cyanobacteriota bacterium]|nr:hypothetical protein [Cyanobacteriota bacterium]
MTAAAFHAARWEEIGMQMAKWIGCDPVDSVIASKEKKLPWSNGIEGTNNRLATFSAMKDANMF